ncbi:hypothetical protein PtA15_1A783 [Puccinia triticina]|uniref:Uncharacterized protein n=1 Tax=Puccinia triticina TaxID=208348 RepID=A0ABY7CAF0_9BASI|nr:uncharacterized protein PtA15_1A783 [Puccinia triticina]WAQ81442.1 hypothetical protein PtA15_1A783 [Puccinia triticina]
MRHDIIFYTFRRLLRDSQSPRLRKVKLTVIDADGLLRNKLVSATNLLSAIKSERLGWCRVPFDWDINDRTYNPDLTISNSQNGYRDLTARMDLETYRCVPWEPLDLRCPDNGFGTLF